MAGDYSKTLSTSSHVLGIINFTPYWKSTQKPTDYVRRDSKIVLVAQINCIWVFPPNRDTPKWMVHNGKPLVNGWFGGTTIWGNTHIDYIVPSLKLTNPKIRYSNHPFSGRVNPSIAIVSLKPFLIGLDDCDLAGIFSPARRMPEKNGFSLHSTARVPLLVEISRALVISMCAFPTQILYIIQSMAHTSRQEPPKNLVSV